MTNNDIYQLAINTSELNTLEYKGINLLGTKSVFVQGERRFEIRRIFNKDYLMDKRLLNDRRKGK